ncbi:MAG: glycosyltransferase family 2 protein [Flavobacteriales bacterium]
MLSVLIPVYNFDVRPLVKDLSTQAQRSGKTVEIICLDDGSKAEFKNQNRSLSQLPGVSYEELPHNTGRSIIRNLLAKKASYDHLLFIDCDSQTESTSYIWNYINALKTDVVIYGGRSYAPDAPQDHAYFLRWEYGRQREVLSPEKRKQHPYRSFMTNNFVVPKSLFLSIGMDESLQGYGHEDTLFAQELCERKIEVVHIDNPLRHIGLETNKVFLEQTANGVRNLHRLIQRNKVLPDNRLFSMYKKLRGTIFGTLFYSWFRRNKQNIESNLCGSNPSLRKFDLYKLGLLLEIDRSS